MARASSRGFLRRQALLVLLALVLASGAAQAQSDRRGSASPRVAELIKQLQSPDAGAQREAARGLAGIKPLPPAAIAPLLDALENPAPPPDVAGYAIRALANVGAPAIPALSHLLEDKRDRNAQLRISVVSALGEMAKEQPAVWPILIGTFSDPRVQSFASMQVAGIGAAVVPLLRQALKNKNPQVRLAAVAALQMRQGAAKAAAPELAEALKDSNPNIRALAADDLSRIGPPAKIAVPALSAVLNDPVRYVRDSAAYALAKIDPTDKASVPILIEALRSDQSVQHWGAVEALGGMGRNALDATPMLELQLATNQQPSFRAAIAKVLGPIAGASAAPSLARALTGDQDPRVRVAALSAITALGPDGAAAIPALVKALGDGDRRIRDGAAETLAGLGKSATPALIAALRNRDLYIREWAIRALGKSKPVAPEVLQTLTPVAFNDQSRSVRVAAITVLTDAGVAAGRKALAQLPPENFGGGEESAGPGNRLYSRAEIFADLPPSDDHEYPLRLIYLLSFARSRGFTSTFEFLATIYRGVERPDRLIFWKIAGAEKYQRLQVIDALPGGSFDPPMLFFPKGQVPGEGVQFVDVGVNLERSHGDLLFAIDRDRLRPVQIEPAEQWYRNKLRPGEEIISPVSNSFSNRGNEFQFYVRSGRKTEQVIGTYKVVKESGFVPGASTGYAKHRGRVVIRIPGKPLTTWKMVVENARLIPIRSR
ncbi:MAG TPA: HEAT repeat domain-containing protein [Candidatus Binataceae bacterium]|nr:HEAT repeat domain-containing protein [Candidatus Binataceae bacterium]